MSPTILCHFCDSPVNISEVGTYRHQAGWVRNRKQGGANSLALPEVPTAWAHGACVDKEKLEGGVSWNQDSMF